ncbi:hypothetical protein [Shimia sediminis]|uniref:hypothetical protein n=1 Tax=Shimia sediminis TaxID=2497945 RepID=UPI000F8E870F|nr:hypothetical protein [Shimia sediminis]
MSDFAERGGRKPAEHQKSPPPFLRAAQGFAIVASLGVGFSSFWGLRDFFIEQGGLIGWVLPLSLAIVVTAMMAFLWHMLLDLAAQKREPVAIALLSGAAIVLTGLMIAISAQFVTSAVGGDAGMRHHKEAYLSEVTELVSALEEQSRLTDQQLSQGSQVAGQLQAYLRCEIARGCLSKRGGGTGPATRVLEDMVSGFSLMQDDASSQAGLQQALLDEARVQIEEARRAARDGDVEGFNDHIALLHAAISRARGEAERLHFDPGFLANSPYAEVARLAKRFDSQGFQMRDEVLSRPVPVFEPMDRYEAAVTYSDKVYMAHVLGVSVELLPLLMFFVVLLSAQIREEEVEPEVGGSTVIDRTRVQDDPDQPILPFAGRPRGYPAE